MGGRSSCQQCAWTQGSGIPSLIPKTSQGPTARLDRQTDRASDEQSSQERQGG